MKIPPAVRAKWLAEKAGWRLANRGDTWYAAERRLYKRQMTELRKSLHLEDLQRRRAEYVAARDAPPKVYEHDEDELESKAESARYLLLRAAATDKARKERELQAANHLYVNTRRRDGRQAAQDADREKFLQRLLEEQDVTGEHVGSFGQRRVRPWVNEQNLERRLSMLLVRPESPISKWDDLSRKTAEEIESAYRDERMGGKLADAAAAAAAPPPSALEGGEGAPAADDAATSAHALAAAELEAARTRDGARAARSVVQVRDGTAADDGTDGFTLLQYSKGGAADGGGGRLTLRERRALLPGESEEDITREIDGARLQPADYAAGGVGGGGGGGGVGGSSEGCSSSAAYRPVARPLGPYIVPASTRPRHRARAADVPRAQHRRAARVQGAPVLQRGRDDRSVVRKRRVLQQCALPGGDARRSRYHRARYLRVRSHCQGVARRFLRAQH